MQSKFTKAIVTTFEINVGEIYHITQEMITDVEIVIVLAVDVH
jgi:hypothetical protein